MKKQHIVTLLILFMGITPALAQRQLKGKVIDTRGVPVASANINLKDSQGNILSFTRTNDRGEYALSVTGEIRDLSLEATIIGFARKAINITELDKSHDLTLEEDRVSLETVVVRNRPSLSVQGDTINYRTSDFADGLDRSIGDVLRKMPGIEVGEDGKVSFNGKGISALYIDGDNVLDGRYSIGTKSIPHGAVDKVQVIEKDQPIKMLRKHNMSDEVALNLVMKEEARLRVMGDVRAGLGTPSRFDGNVNAMMFKKKMKFINNIQGNNNGIDPGIELTSFDPVGPANQRPGEFLSAGAAGVPTLPQRRTLFNKAGLANLNNLYNFNGDLQAKVNFSYLYDRRTQRYGKFSRTYLSGQTIAYDEFQDNLVNPQKLQGKLNLISNAVGHYFNDTFTVNFFPSRTISNVIANGVSANQVLTQRPFEVSNEMGYRKKLRSGHSFNFHSLIGRTAAPEQLSIEPGLNEAVFNDGKPFARLSQYVELPTWYTNNHTSFGIAGGKLVQTYKLGFDMQGQNLSSALYRMQDDMTAELVSQDTRNDLAWFKGKVFADAGYEYISGKFKVGLGLPISYNLISYEDQSKALDETSHKVFVNPSLNLRYQTGTENYLTANYDYRDDLGGPDDVYQGTILKNYRSLFANDAPVSQSRTQVVGASFSFRKAMQMLFFNLGVSYTNTALNTISSFVLDNNIQQRVVLPFENDIASLSVGASASKYLFALRSTVNVGLSFTRTTFGQIQNGELLPFTAQGKNFKGGMDSKITSYLNWSYVGTFSLSGNTTINGISNNSQQLRQKSNITATAFKGLYLTLAAEHILTHQSSQADLKYLFADFNARYRLKELRTDLELGITNLANVKKFEASFLSANSISSGSYVIPGRVAMLRATVSF